MSSKSLREMVRERQPFGPLQHSTTDEDKYCCPYHDNDINASLAVYNDGHAYCFGCKITLQIKQVKALVDPALAARTSGEPFREHPRLGVPERYWTYRNKHGEPVFMVYRFGTIEADGSIGKTTRSASLDAETGEWKWGGMPKQGRPLYNLHAIAADPSADIIVVEGEKAADAVTAANIPGVVATTAVNGTNSVSRCDWTCLKGRNVFIWPDNDPPGEGYATSVVSCLAGAGIIGKLDVSKFPPKADAADFPTEFVAATVGNRLNWPRETAPLVSAGDNIGGSEKAQQVLNTLLQINAPRLHVDQQGVVYMVATKGAYANKVIRVGGVGNGTWDTVVDTACGAANVAINEREAKIIARAVIAAADSKDASVAKRFGIDGTTLYIKATSDTAIRCNNGAMDMVFLSDCPMALKAPIINKDAHFTVATPTKPFREMFDEVFSAVPVAIRPALAAWIALSPIADMIVGPALYFVGGAGSGKTTAARFVKLLVDPEYDAVQTLPASLKDLTVILNTRDAMLFDNLGGMTSEASNTLCIAVTGGTMVARKLYTDAEAAPVRVRANMIFTSIMTQAKHQDLLDRCLFIQTSRPEVFRGWFETTFAEYAPMMRCYIAHAASVSLAAGYTHCEAGDFRFPDWLCRAAAILPTLGYSVDELMGALLENAAALEDEVGMESQFVNLVTLLVQKSEGGVWSGTASELYTKLTAAIPYDDRQNMQNFPRCAEQVGRYLRSYNAMLMKVGVTCARKKSGSVRTIVLRYAEK